MHINKFLSNSSIECTFINIFVNNTAVCAIVDSGAPFNIVTTWLCKKLNILPDLDYAKEFGTDGQFSTTLQGAFSALLLWFGGIVVSAPAVVVPSTTYNMLIGTSFLKRYKVIMDHDSSSFHILGCNLPILYKKILLIIPLVNLST